MTELTLKPEQRHLVDLAVAEPTRAALVGDETGFGKTLSAVEIAKALAAKTVLVIAPLNTKDSWTSTFTRQNFPHADLRQIDSSKAGKAAYADLLSGTPGVYFFVHSMFGLSSVAKPANPEYDKNGNPHPRAGKGERKAWTNWTTVSKHLDLAILDESHQGALNRDNVTVKALRTLKPGFKLAMSATPAGNQFSGLWPVCRWLWPDARNEAGELYVDSSLWRWAATWATLEYNEHSASKKKIAGERVPGSFVASLPCYVRRESFKVPVDTFTVQVPLTHEQRTLWDDMKHKSLMWLSERPYVAELPVVQGTRLRQIALGEVTFNDDGEIDFAMDCASNKADTCAKIIQRETGKPIVFFTTSQKFARVLANRLGPDAKEWSGKISVKDRDTIKEHFIAGKVKYIVATIASINAGVDGLQKVCHTEVWLDQADGVKNIQASGRLNRQGQPAERITRYVLHSDPSDDPKMAEKLVLQAVEMRATLSK